jgi:TolA-binding protein
MLKPRKRITKKQLKEDKLVTFYFKARTWAEENGKYLYIGAGIIALVIVLLFVNAKSKRAAEENASVELLRARKIFESGDYQNAITQFSNLVENYGSTRSGKLGFFYLANSFYLKGDFENAQKNFKKFVSGFNGDEYLMSSGMGGIAACAEQNRKYVEAAELYAKIAKKYPKGVLAPHFLIRSGRCFVLANNESKAKEQYEKIIKNYPNAQEKDEALMLMTMIKG